MEPVYIIAQRGFFKSWCIQIGDASSVCLKIDRGINISNVSFIAFCSLRMDSYDFGDALKHMVSFSHNLVLFGCLEKSCNPARVTNEEYIVRLSMPSARSKGVTHRSREPRLRVKIDKNKKVINGANARFP